MRIAIGSDHRGCGIKELVMKLLADKGYEYKDFGCYTEDSVDYPDIAVQVDPPFALRWRPFVVPAKRIFAWAGLTARILTGSLSSFSSQVVPPFKLL